MKALILSDIHGSAIAARKALSYFDSFHCDKIFLLGDTLYHGPRNPLPEGHGPMGVVEALRPYADKIIAVRGNCDADVDLMMLEFFHIEDEYTVVEDGPMRLFLSHGHIFMPESFPKDALLSLEPSQNAAERPIDAYLYGHTHIWQIEKNFRKVLLVNPGSTSLPKGGNVPTFGLYQGPTKDTLATFSIHDLESGKQLAKTELKR